MPLSSAAANVPAAFMALPFNAEYLPPAPFPYVNFTGFYVATDASPVF